MLSHYLAKFRSSSFGMFGRNCKQKCNMHWFLNTSNFNTLSLLTYLLFQFPVPVKYSLYIADDFIWTIVVNWSSVFCMFGMALTRPSLTVQVTSGVDVFAHVCGQKADTSSNYCDNSQRYDERRFRFCQMWHNFYIVFVGNYYKF